MASTTANVLHALKAEVQLRSGTNFHLSIPKTWIVAWAIIKCSGLVIADANNKPADKLKPTYLEQYRPTW